MLTIKYLLGCRMTVVGICLYASTSERRGFGFNVFAVMTLSTCSCLMLVCRVLASRVKASIAFSLHADALN